MLGTRPEIIKLAPVIQALDRPPMIVHTGQHYDDEMSGSFFSVFALPPPSHNLGIGGQTRGQQIGQTISGLDEILDEAQPEAVVVQGDTNTTMGSAIAANAHGIPLVHIEAGLRSYDRAMPEEHNRVVADHLADLHLVPTDAAAANLAAEGISGTNVVVTGNTVVDSVLFLLDKARADPPEKNFVLSTFHRPENVDNPNRLRRIVAQLADLDLPVVFAVHPRTASMAEANDIDLDAGNIHSRPPAPYMEFLELLASCSLVIGDSGGLQEEVSVVKKPMVVVRNSTERPEVLGSFCTLVSSVDDIASDAAAWLEGIPHSEAELREIPSPYGDGTAGQKSAIAIEGLSS